MAWDKNKIVRSQKSSSRVSSGSKSESEISIRIPDTFVGWLWVPSNLIPTNVWRQIIDEQLSKEYFTYERNIENFSAHNSSQLQIYLHEKTI